MELGHHGSELPWKLQQLNVNFAAVIFFMC